VNLFVTRTQKRYWRRVNATKALEDVRRSTNTLPFNASGRSDAVVVRNCLSYWFNFE
jgi:hypothetical protein